MEMTIMSIVSIAVGAYKFMKTLKSAWELSNAMYRNTQSKINHESMCVAKVS